MQRGYIANILRNLSEKSESSAPAAPSLAEGASRRSLPRIQLPNFTGAYEEWPAYRDLFRSLVDKDTSLSLVEKLHYLKSSLRGEPEVLIRNLPTTGENFARAWSTLTEHYENKRLLVKSCFTAYTALPHIKTESAQEFKRVFHRMMSTVGTLESIGQPISDCRSLCASHSRDARFAIPPRVGNVNKREVRSALLREAEDILQVGYEHWRHSIVDDRKRGHNPRASQRRWHVTQHGRTLHSGREAASRIVHCVTGNTTSFSVRSSSKRIRGRGRTLPSRTNCV